MQHFETDRTGKVQRATYYFMPRHCVRVAKEMDSKSIGLWPQGFESPRCRLLNFRLGAE
jgi:hypothetical protein